MAPNSHHAYAGVRNGNAFGHHDGVETRNIRNWVRHEIQTQPADPPAPPPPAPQQRVNRIIWSGALIGIIVVVTLLWLASGAWSCGFESVPSRPAIKDIFQGTAGKEPGCDRVGEDGAGHFVKIGHSGIEYGNIQVIAKAHHIMRDIVGLSNDEMSQALYARKIVYSQDFMLFREGAKQMGWKLNNGDIALMWRGGFSIRSAFLGDIKKPFDKQPDLSYVLLDDFFKKAITDAQEGWRKVVATAVKSGIPVPAMSSALSLYDGVLVNVSAAKLPASLIQAQRDFFGAQVYKLMDAPGKFVHTNWTGRGGTKASSIYSDWKL